MADTDPKETADKATDQANEKLEDGAKALEQDSKAASDQAQDLREKKD